MTDDSRLHSNSILICDDNSDTRILIRYTLQDLGCQMFEACDGNESVEHCKKQLPDLIILDIMMPGLSGFEVVKWLREEYPSKHIPVLLLTALTELEHKVEGLELGADDYLIKPFSPGELRARIKALLRIKNLTDELEFRNVELNKVNEELEKTQIALVDKERQLAAGQLAGATLHKIGQPVTTMRLVCRMLYNCLAELHNREPEVVLQAREHVVSLETECSNIENVLKDLVEVDASKVVSYVGSTDILDL